MLAQDYMRQKRERTGTSILDNIKDLNIYTKRKKFPAKFNLAYGGCVACGIDTCPSLTCDLAIFFKPVMLTVTLTRLFCFAFLPTVFEEKRGR